MFRGGIVIHLIFPPSLPQTQEFQGVAKGLERWMSGIDELLCQQDRIAVRCRLVEPQMEAFKVYVMGRVYSTSVKWVLGKWEESTQQVGRGTQQVG